MDLTLNHHFDDDGIRFEHGDDEGSITLSYAEIRNLGTVSCPTCGIVLGTHAFLIQSMDGGIAKAEENPNFEQRRIAQETLSKHKSLLLDG